MDASQPHARSGEPNFEYRRWLSSAPPGEEVVISGMSGRLPDSRTIHEFRDKLFSKTDMVNDRRWKLDHPEIPQRGGKIPDVDRFDAGILRNAPSPNRSYGRHDANFIGDRGRGDHGRRNESLGG
jgi:hypothetical protein